MKKLIFFVVSLSFCISLQAQCNYVWQSSDKQVQTSNYLYSPKIKFDSLNILLSKVVDKLKFIRIDDKSLEWVDSFKRGEISDTTYLPYSKTFFAKGKEKWLLEVTYNNVGYLLTQVDTIKYKGKDVYVYKLSTNLTSFWNEDFDNWIFYYCSEFGIIKYFNNPINDLSLIDENYILKDISCVKQKWIFKSIKQKYTFSLSE